MRDDTDAETAQEMAQEAPIMVWRRPRASTGRGVYRHLDLHDRWQEADLPAAPGRPADRHRGLADGYAPEGEDAEKSIRSGQTYTWLEEVLGSLWADQLVVI